MKTKWTFTELKGYHTEPLHIEGELSLDQLLLEKSDQILETKPVQYSGFFFYDPVLDDVALNLSIQTDVKLPSSRSLKPVDYTVDINMTEIFVLEADGKHEREEEFEYSDDQIVTTLESATDFIQLEEIVVDHIVLSLPSQIFTPEELASDDMPEGNNWQVFSEEQFSVERAKAKEEQSPFQVLKDLFPNEDED